MARVPQHVIKSSTIKVVASEELQREVEQELASASKEDTPDMSELLQASDEEVVEDEAEDEVSKDEVVSEDDTDEDEDEA